MKMVIAGQVFDIEKTPITFAFESGLEARGVILAMTTSLTDSEERANAKISDVVVLSLRGANLADVDIKALEHEAYSLAFPDLKKKGE